MQMKRRYGANTA